MIPSWLSRRRLGKEPEFMQIPIPTPQGEGHLHYEVSRSWDDHEEHNLLRDVAFNRHSMNDGEHVSPYDNSRINIGDDNIIVKLVTPIDKANMRAVMSKATRATIGINLDEGEPEDDRDWEEMLRGGLQTALENIVVVFEVSGVSRTCTHQLVRSRRAAFHQQSQRASYYGDQPEARMPESVWNNPRARMAWFYAKAASDWAYRVATEEDISYQDARYALLEGTDNYIMLEYTLREFMNVYAYRGCSMFSWEIVSVMRKCREALIADSPWLEPHVKISCEKTAPAVISNDVEIVRGDGEVIRSSPSVTVEHHCTFQGWESVEGQCSFPWAKEQARTFQPSFHAIGRRSDG